MRHIYHLIGRLDNRAISWTTVLYSVTEDSWGIRHWVVAIVYLCAAFIVDVLEVEGVDVAGDVSVDWTSAVVGGMWEAGLKLV